MEKSIEKLTDAIKGHPDLVALAIFAITGVYALSSGIDLLSVLLLIIVLTGIWVVLSYVNLSIRSKDKLNEIRFDASVRSQKAIAKHATNDEIRAFLETKSNEGGIE